MVGSEEVLVLPTDTPSVTFRFHMFASEASLSPSPRKGPSGKPVGHARVVSKSSAKKRVASGLSSSKPDAGFASPTSSLDPESEEVGNSTDEDKSMAAASVSRSGQGSSSMLSAKRRRLDDLGSGAGRGTSGRSDVSAETEAAFEARVRTMDVYQLRVSVLCRTRNRNMQ